MSSDNRPADPAPRLYTATILFDPVSGSLVVIRSGAGSDPVKEGPPPASEAAIWALPVVKIEEEDLECAICMEEYEIGGEAKEMTCKHRFHSGCLEKWLRANGSCPVCRCKVPVVEEGGKDEKGEVGERRESGEGRELRIRFVDGEMVIDQVNSD